MSRVPTNKIAIDFSLLEDYYQLRSYKKHEMPCKKQPASSGVGFPICREERTAVSKQCSIYGRQPSEEVHGLVDHLVHCELEGSLHEVLHELDKDVSLARKRTQSLLGLITRRGQVRFVVLEEGSELAKEFKACGFCVSAIKLSDKHRLSRTELKEAFAQIRSLRGARINGLEELLVHRGTATEQYFTFHIDLEAA